MQTETANPPEGKPAPRFSLFRILTAGFLIYTFLNSVIVFFSILKNYPLAVISKNPEGFKKLILAGKSQSDEERQAAFEAFFNPEQIFNIFVYTETLVQIGILLGLAVLLYLHYPLYRYFLDLRKGRKISEERRAVCKKRLLASAPLSGFLPTGIVFVIYAGAFLTILLGQAKLEQNLSLAYPLQMLSLVLVAIFIFKWQKHRVRKHFLHFVFTPAELHHNLPAQWDINIKKRLWLASIMTTILPLMMVTLFILSSISYVPEAKSLGETELKLLLGEYFEAAEQSGLRTHLLTFLKTKLFKEIPGLLHFNAINTVILLAGVALGILVSLVYSYFFVRLTTADIIDPVRELGEKMRETEEGRYDNFMSIRTNDELGELTRGFNHMLRGLAERDKIKGLFGQYLTREVSEEILKGRVNMSGDNFEATVMFADIRNFTAMSEKLAPREVLQFLNDYLGCMINVIVEHNGIIDKFIGDGILAVFGAPLRSDKHAADALSAALAMDQALAGLNRERKEKKLKPIAVGVGLHSGPVIAGNIGNSSKLEYTVLGDTVNLASRIEGLTKVYRSSILISDAVYERLPEELLGDLNVRALPRARVKGKKKSVKLYKVKNDRVKSESGK